jgi:hypothetical protein
MGFLIDQSPDLIYFRTSFGVIKESGFGHLKTNDDHYRVL